MGHAGAAQTAALEIGLDAGDEPDVHGNNRKDVEAVTDHAWHEQDTKLAYARFSNVTGSEFNPYFMKNEALLIKDGGGDKADRRRARRAARQMTELILSLQRQNELMLAEIRRNEREIE